MAFGLTEFLLLFTGPWTVQGGAPECPCLNSSSALAQEVAAELKTKGLPETYGLLGCQTYDLGKSYSHGSQSVDCTGASRADPDRRYCFTPWCYVDESVCRVSEEDCPSIGSSSNPLCRTRPKTMSALIQGQAVFYSYETCGAMNTYVAEHTFPEMDGRVLRIAPMLTKPTSFQDDSGSWTGSFIEFWRSTLRAFDGTSMEIADPLISQESRNQINSSSWTACVHDVGIGRLDACIGDFWVTHDRLQLASFLPSFYDQPQYFLMTVKEKESIADILWKPFAPLEFKAWVLIVIFLTVAGLALFCAEGMDNSNDFPPDMHIMTRVCLSLYYGVAAMFGGSTVTPQTTAGRIISLGLGFFVLIATSTYTASIASFLVTNSLSGDVSSFEEAIAANYRICVDRGMGNRLLRAFPDLDEKGLLLMNDHHSLCPGKVHRGEAEGMIMSPPAMERMYAGVFAQGECVEGSEYLNDEVTCPRGEDGGVDLTRDCEIRRVGDAPAHVSISMPVSTELQHALGWAVTRGIQSGTLRKFQDQFRSESYAAKDVCPPLNQVDESQAIPISGFLGSLVIASICVLSGLLLAAVGTIRKHRAAAADSTDLQVQTSTPSAHVAAPAAAADSTELQVQTSTPSAHVAAPAMQKAPTAMQVDTEHIVEARNARL